MLLPAGETRALELGIERSCAAHVQSRAGRPAGCADASEQLPTHGICSFQLALLSHAALPLHPSPRSSPAATTCARATAARCCATSPRPPSRPGPPPHHSPSKTCTGEWSDWLSGARTCSIRLSDGLSTGQQPRAALHPSSTAKCAVCIVTLDGLPHSFLPNYSSAAVCHYALPP